MALVSIFSAFMLAHLGHIVQALRFHFLYMNLEETSLYKKIMFVDNFERENQSVVGSSNSTFLKNSKLRKHKKPKIQHFTFLNH